MKTPILSEKQKAQFEDDGFLIVAHQCASELRTKVIEAMTRLAIGALSRTQGWESKAREFAASGIAVDEMLSEVVAHEGPNNEVSAMLYRLFVNVPEIIGLVENPFFLALSKELGVSMPVPSTLPITRIDRPSDTVHKVPAHQDYWYSFLSDNSVTLWFTLAPWRKKWVYWKPFRAVTKGGSFHSSRIPGAQTPMSSMKTFLKKAISKSMFQKILY
jgi:hypothetical protein